MRFLESIDTEAYLDFTIYGNNKEKRITITTYWDDDEVVNTLNLIGVAVPDDEDFSELEVGKDYRIGNLDSNVMAQVELNVDSYDIIDIQNFSELIDKVNSEDNVEAVINAVEVTDDFGEAVEGLENGSIIYYPGVNDKWGLAEQVIDMMGGMSELSDDTIERYFDFEALGKSLDNDDWELGTPRATGEADIYVSDIGVAHGGRYDDYEEFDDFGFHVDEDMETEEHTIENDELVENAIRERYNLDNPDDEIEYDYNIDCEWEKYCNAGEYFLGNADADYDDIGREYVAQVGGIKYAVSSPKDYFNFYSYGEDLTREGFTLTSSGAIEYV